jgi:hypothetical protein
VIIRDTPKNIDDYMLVTDAELTAQLHEMGVYPMYIDPAGVYFLKSAGLRNALNKLNLPMV